MTQERREAIARLLWLRRGGDPVLWDETGRGADPSWKSYMAPVRKALLDDADAILTLPAREVGERARTMAITLTQREQDALERLMAEQDLSAFRVMICALREYQMGHERRRAGETVKWSGDEQRAREFAALATTPAPREKLEADLVEAKESLSYAEVALEGAGEIAGAPIALRRVRATLAKLDRSGEVGR